MIDLSTDYLGLRLKNPLVVSASPLCEDIANIKRMEDAGAAAVVLQSLFEEQITLESNELDTHLSHGEHYAEAVSYFPDLGQTKLGPEPYLEHVGRANNTVDVVPVLVGQYRGEPRPRISPRLASLQPAFHDASEFIWFRGCLYRQVSRMRFAILAVAVAARWHAPVNIENLRILSVTRWQETKL